MNTDKFLHILRNPYGFSKEEVKQAGLDACDAYERLFKELKEMTSTKGVFKKALITANNIAYGGKKENKLAKEDTK